MILFQWSIGRSHKTSLTVSRLDCMCRWFEVVVPGGCVQFKYQKKTIKIIVLHGFIFFLRPSCWDIFHIVIFAWLYHKVKGTLTDFIKRFLLLSLGRYLCLWTIGPWGYHLSSSQCFIRYIYYWNLMELLIKLRFSSLNHRWP